MSAISKKGLKSSVFFTALISVFNCFRDKEVGFISVLFTFLFFLTVYEVIGFISGLLKDKFDT